MDRVLISFQVWRNYGRWANRGTPGLAPPTGHHDRLVPFHLRSRSSEFSGWVKSRISLLDYVRKKLKKNRKKILFQRKIKDDLCSGVVGRGAPRKYGELCREGHVGYGFKGGNGTGPLCLDLYYWGFRLPDIPCMFGVMDVKRIWCWGWKALLIWYLWL